MSEDLLHEIQQAFLHDDNRNIELNAKRQIRRFISESKPFLMQDLYSLTQKRIQENHSDDNVQLLEMMLTLLKREVTFND